ncbi:hypothetical protein THRCLA_04712 [Thraustotheca clavata]|uniref:tRNA threonylcarbamoyladenosine biosynthesis protein TsaE n=1 Tax=Thraustotheca clavata TaxID=74557 RepID=A0A1V9ZY85_9STRA|nr:hypothetical protein THRCLA_04712 [Thraustotheca clavata]
MLLKHVRKTGCRWLHVQSVRVRDAEAMEAFGAELATHVPHPSTIFLVGNLGCGKTCLARGFVRTWTKDESMLVTSPTYLLMNTYEENQKSLYHMDLYRLDKVSSIDATAMGLDEVFATSTNLIEWPDRLTPQLVPSTRLEVHIAYTDNEDERVIEFKYFGSIWNNVKQWFASKN